MTPGVIKKIVYLFGAGATHAELVAINPNLESTDGGLLISDLSRRVMLKASRDPSYIKDVKIVSGTGGSLNIELLISLIENSKIDNWSSKTTFLKQLVKDDITSVISSSGIKHFFLHKGLLEFHGHTKAQAKEELLGLISLNYDDILDRAYVAILRGEINYCFSREMDSQVKSRLPLLKLHGSFNWKKRHVLCKKRNIDIIPLGSNKSYLHAPYGFIWNRALDILTQCDALRIIGCSLSPNDVHLIDLLFKAQLERREPFDIEIIAPEPTYEAIKSNYGFFRNIKRLADFGIPSAPVVGPINPFKTWLHYTAEKIFDKDELNTMPNLRKATH